MTIEKHLTDSIVNSRKVETQQWFEKLIQQNEYIGELYSIDYETARVIIHDSERKKVGGIPSLSFLVATRIDPGKAADIDFKTEDASFILLRVMDSAPLPQDKEAERIRVETAQRVSGEIEKHWDSDGAMDAKTRVLLGYAGIQCRIIGTFYLEENAEKPTASLALKFGSDISNYYPNRGLKIFRPNSTALEEIVNYCDPSNKQEHREKYKNTETVKLGFVRYASTNRKYQQIDDVPVYIYPADLLSQKSALFGMTRTGKSNTTKIIAKSVFELRAQEKKEDEPLRIGQIIFDPNGEYAVKLNPANEEEVIDRLLEIYRLRNYYSRALEQMPEFFRICYCDEVLKFLLAVRANLNWESNNIDATLMSILLIYLHAKLKEGLSNQMRMTKSMGMNYSVEWWKKNKMFAPPEINPCEFILKKIRWRYEKGKPNVTESHVLFGDSTNELTSIAERAIENNIRFSLLFTSPPYYSITDYHADQWLRLWLLGGTASPQKNKDKYKGRFIDKEEYYGLLDSVFGLCSTMMKRKSTIYVRTDKREFTFNSTLEILEKYFPKHEIEIIAKPLKKDTPTQTKLYGDKTLKPGEVDIILTR